jgi:uncharacterized small protein (DUF1192 family)
MYRYVSGVLVLSALLLGVSVTHAETPQPPNRESRIGNEQSKDMQIARLRARIVELEREIARLRGETSTVSVDDEWAWLARGAFRMGVEGDDVRRLQEWLSQMPEIYPEGKVTGYFGPLTRQAVMRFEMKNGLTPDGQFDAQTIEKFKMHFRSKGDSSGKGNGRTRPPLGANGGIPVCLKENSEHTTVYVQSVTAFREHLASGAKPGRCKTEHDDNTDDAEDEDETEDIDDSEDVDERELEIEVEIRNGDAFVTVEIEGDTDTFTLDSTDREDIIEEIDDRYTSLTEDEIEAVIKFEEEDTDEDDD